MGKIMSYNLALDPSDAYYPCQHKQVTVPEVQVATQCTAKMHSPIPR